MQLAREPSEIPIRFVDREAAQQPAEHIPMDQSIPAALDDWSVPKILSGTKSTFWQISCRASMIIRRLKGTQAAYPIADGISDKQHLPLPVMSPMSSLARQQISRKNNSGACATISWKVYIFHVRMGICSIEKSHFFLRSISSFFYLLSFIIQSTTCYVSVCFPHMHTPVLATLMKSTSRGWPSALPSVKQLPAHI
jgi:hypothetical protein